MTRIDDFMVLPSLFTGAHLPAGTVPTARQPSELLPAPVQRCAGSHSFCSVCEIMLEARNYA